MNIEQQLARFNQNFQKLRSEIGKVVVGQEEVVDGVIICLIADGHALLEGVPGLGKTLLVRTLADTCNLKFFRIQFTPDLMPADIVGTNILVEKEGGVRQFEFQYGPIFANIVLADEVNRATPKTQSAMLEAMQEKSVTIAGAIRKLDEPFIVLATQNPLEMEGTYPLPEAQLDRFMFKIMVSFPSIEELTDIIQRTTSTSDCQAQQVVESEDLIQMRKFAREVTIAPHVQEYALKMVLATHPNSEYHSEMTNQYVRYGSSPRGAQALVLGAKVCALLDGRYNVAFDDIKNVSKLALRHRLILNFEGEAERVDPDTIIEDIIASLEPKAEIPV